MMFPVSWRYSKNVGGSSISISVLIVSTRKSGETHVSFSTFVVIFSMYALNCEVKATTSL